MRAEAIAMLLWSVSKSGGKGSILDYGNLMVETLKRASTAREAVKVAARLADEYGYASSMEGFSISDGDGCWYMELKYVEYNKRRSNRCGWCFTTIIKMGT